MNRLLTIVLLSAASSFGIQSAQAETFSDHVVTPQSLSVRPLVPEEAQAVANPFDGYLRQAARSAGSGKFDDAVIQFGRADAIASNECERRHAQAGATAAQEAKQKFKQYGWRSKPTQLFAGRFWSLTTDLPCVQQL